MNMQELSLLWFPPLTAEEAAAREARLDAVYQTAGYRSLDLDRLIAVTVDQALEAVHNQGTQAAPIEQPAAFATSVGKEGL